MVAQPALAATGYHVAERNVALSGDRTHIRIDGRVLDTAPRGGLGLNAALGAGDNISSFGIVLEQVAGTGLANRELTFDSYGQFRNSAGPGCTFADFGSGGWGRLQCRQPGYNWTMDRYYRMSVVRGGQHATLGWLWTVNVTDLKTGTTTKVVSFRNPNGRLTADDRHGAYLYSNIANCDAIDRMAAAVRKPVAAGSTVTWQPPSQYRGEGCDPTIRNVLDANGNLTLVIAQ